MSHAIHVLAVAHDTLVKVTENAESAHATHNVLLVRKSEAEAKSAEAIRDARDGRIDEATAALRMSIASQDAKGIQVLIDESMPVLASLDAAVLRAQAQVAKAEVDARNEENELTAIELTSHVDKLHAALTEAIKERHQYYRKVGLNAAAADLMKRIKALERQLLEAVAECYDIHVEMDPPRSPTSRKTSSVHDFYKPSLALHDVVRQGAKPRI
jgi:hypothetical protein